MIDPEDRFWVDGGSSNGIVDEAFIMDWDKRRHYTIFGPTTLLKKIQEEEDSDEIAINIWKRHMDKLDPDVHTIRVNAEGSIVSTCSDPDQDLEWAICYPSLLDAPTLAGASMIEMSKLTELDRFGPGCDLVSYQDEAGNKQTVVFKNSPIVQFRHRRWREMNILHSLPEHPGLISLDRIVVDDKISQHILGFTVPYIPGMDLEKNCNQTFRLEWLRQLTRLVDYLDLDLNLAHQDVAPRNIICLEEADRDQQVQLFDFDYATLIGLPWCVPDRNDVRGVIFTLYEIITLDESYRSVPHWEQDPEAVMNLENWPQKRVLDADVSEFRAYLDDWVRRRKAVASPLPENVPPFPEMPDPRPVVEDIDAGGKAVYLVRPCNRRSIARKFGNYVINWEREPSIQFDISCLCPKT